MQTGYTGFVDRTEWRWVSLVSAAIIITTFVPFLLVALASPNTNDTVFMGILHDHIDTAAVLGRMTQGANQGYLLDFLYTPQEQDGLIIHPIYSLLGQLAGFTQLSTTTMFHVLRIFISMFMYVTIYYLAANIWVRVRTRRIFFVVASASAGFGWLLAPLMAFLAEQTIIPDLTLPQLYPLYAAASNLHYPVAIICVTLIIAIIIPILRPGDNTAPSLESGGVVVFGASTILAFVYPDAFLPLGLAYICNVLVNWIAQGRVTRHEITWGLWILVPALPIITYYIITYETNPFLASWISQRGEARPDLLILIGSLGIPFILAIPGVIRAIRRFEPDGDRLMLLWLLAMVITAYLPLRLNQYLLLGIMIPIGYFATRGVEDYWFTVIRRIYRPRVYLVVFPLLILSHLVWLFFPVYPIIAGWQGNNAIVLDDDYIPAFDWIEQRTGYNTVVLAAPDVSLWIPAQTGAHVVYGHPDETLNAVISNRNVRQWYLANDVSASICDELLAEYDIDYIIYGAREQLLGAGACVEGLAPVRTFGSLTIYTSNERIE